MKTILNVTLFAGWLLVCAAPGTVSAADQTTNSSPRIGIYDSRAVAYAYFWSEPQQKHREELIAAAQTARKSGDTNQFKALSQQLKSLQAQGHRQVFSTAPVDEILAGIKDRLPALQKQAGVAKLVSRWDAAGLKTEGMSERVDVTDQLVREFIVPTENQQKTIQALREKEPLSLEKCDELIRDGKI